MRNQLLQDFRITIPCPNAKQNPSFCSETLSSRHILHVHSCKSLLCFLILMDKIQLRSVDLRKLIVSDFSAMFEPSQLVGQILSINSILVICSNARLCWGKSIWDWLGLDPAQRLINCRDFLWKNYRVQFECTLITLQTLGIATIMWWCLYVTIYIICYMINMIYIIYTCYWTSHIHLKSPSTSLHGPSVS